MRLDNLNRIYFLGIGGIGMSALARYFNFQGKTVSGYDKTQTQLTEALEKEGIQITYSDSVRTLDTQADLVVYTPAIPQNSVQLNYFKTHHFLLKKRAKILGEIANSLYNISIAGSHGKTSTSSLVAYLLHQAGKDTAAFLGGIALNFNSNFIHGNTIAVAEADEFDRSFLNLKPNIALVTSIDTDHLETYGDLDAIRETFSQFISQVHDNGLVFLNQKVIDNKLIPPRKFYTYSLEDNQTDYYASNLKAVEGSTYFDLHTPDGIFKNLILHYGGKHNLENAVGASAIALNMGLTEKELRTGLATFKGVRRRFQTIFKDDKHILIDDYAHHPREIDAVIRTVRDLYPNKHLTVIFQPHLFSRTRDLAREFSKSLSAADSVILLPIYPARELPIEGVTSKLIFDGLSVSDSALIEYDQLISYLENLSAEGVVMTVGAGNIENLIPHIANLFKSVRL